MTKEEMASQLLQFGDFYCKNDVFFQKEEAISLFDRNRKGKYQWMPMFKMLRLLVISKEIRLIN